MSRAVMVRRVSAARVSAVLGVARQAGLVGVSPGWVRPGRRGRYVVARNGSARLGRAWRGRLGSARMARHCVVRPVAAGQASYGVVRPDKFRHGAAGKAGSVASRLVGAWPVRAWLGEVRQARHGLVRQAAFRLGRSRLVVAGAA